MATMTEDIVSEVERQSAFSRAFHSIRTRYSLVTAFFLLLALGLFYVGGRIVLVHLVRDAEEQVRQIGYDISRIAYHNADKVRRQALALTESDGDAVRPNLAQMVSEPRPFTVAADFDADGRLVSGMTRGEGQRAIPLSEVELVPYREALCSWCASTRRIRGGSATGIVRLAGKTHYVTMVRFGTGCLMLGMPFDPGAFTAEVNDNFVGMDVRITNRKADVTVSATAPSAAVRRSKERSGFGIAPIFSEALDFYSGGFWNLDSTPFEAIFALRDIAGNAISMVAVSIPKTFSNVTRVAVGRLSFYIALGGILLVLPLFWFQSRVLLNPPSKMTAEVAKLGQDHADTDCPRLDWKGKDEFAILAASVNRMLETLSVRSLSVAQAESRHQALIDVLPDALTIFDPQGKLVAITKEADGVPMLPGFHVGEPPTEAVFGSEPVANFCNVLKAVFETGVLGKTRLQVQRPIGADKEVPTRHFELRISKMDEHFALVVVRDVTEEVAEHQLRLAAERRNTDSKKRESLTLLAAGIAHDMNNVLSVVLSAAESEGADPSGDSSETLRTIRDAVRRGSSMMRELMTYAGESRIKLVRLNPNVIMEDIKYLVSRVVAKNVEVTYVPGANMPFVDADPNQFWKVPFNIVKNAGEAIGTAPGHVRLSVSAHDFTEEDAKTFLSERPLPPGKGVLFVVQDDGPGISPEFVGKLFDPYVSSKAVGRGLGLATVRTIIEAHGGAIQVTSDRGRNHGTTFQIFLPESKLESVRAPMTETLFGHLSGDVLVVDDELAIRKTTSILLKSLKLTPFTAADPQEAMSVVRRRADTLSVVILDADLGGIDTVRLLGSIRRTAPKVPVIVSTGSAEELIRKLYADQPYDGFLAKPYTRDELKVTLLATVLGNAESSDAQTVV